MLAWRYEFYFLVVKNNILLAALVGKIFSLPLENKIHIFAPPCNILYVQITINNNYNSHSLRFNFQLWCLVCQGHVRDNKKI